MTRTILSIAIDSVIASAAAFTWDSASRSLASLPLRVPPKDMRSTVKLSSGKAVATLIGDYVRDVQTSLGSRNFDAIGVSAPGTIDTATGIVLKSTRLGVLEELNFGAVLKDRYGMAATLVNDAAAAAIGEVRYGVGKALGLHEADDLCKFGDFAYVLVSEGVGCALFINGRRYLGGGAAGHLGRMTMDPSGQISELFSSRAPLESYASREAISRQMVAAFRNAKDKSKHETLGRFDRILAAAPEWSQIPAPEIASAVADGHQIALSAVNEAARYLGIAIGALITIMNPPTVILGGDMIQTIPHFFGQAAHETEQFTWSIAWNKTRFLQGLVADPQHWGAAQLAGEQRLL